MVADGIADLAPYAAERGVKLAIEPLHRCSAPTAPSSPPSDKPSTSLRTSRRTRSASSSTPTTSGGPAAGVRDRARRAGHRLHIYQECDWVVPLPADMLLGRGHVGDGHIDFARIRRLVRDAGYQGFTEVEIFNQEIWMRRATRPWRPSSPGTRASADGDVVEQGVRRVARVVVVVADQVSV